MTIAVDLGRKATKTNKNKLTHIRVILKHYCLSGMLGIIQSKIT